MTERAGAVLEAVDHPALKVELACALTPATQALADGSVEVAGASIRFFSLPAEETFRRVLLGGEFDAAEMSLATCFMRHDQGDDLMVPIPIFPARAFRHSMLWVRDGGGIRSPRALIGRRIGIRRYASTALVYLRGILADDYGVDPTQVTWVRSGYDDASVAIPSSVPLEQTEPAADLFELLAAGRLDAVAEFWDLRAQRGRAGVRRLFDDVRAVEADYFRRTSVYPIMHTIIIRRALYERHRWLAGGLARAFQATASTRTGVPWRWPLGTSMPRG
jgi:4,5-dihydroxyphthalate decarboxylase